MNVTIRVFLGVVVLVGILMAIGVLWSRTTTAERAVMLALGILAASFDIYFLMSN
jgi:hypothetical protein